MEVSLPQPLGHLRNIERSQIPQPQDGNASLDYREMYSERVLSVTIAFLTRARKENYNSSTILKAVLPGP